LLAVPIENRKCKYIPFTLRQKITLDNFIKQCGTIGMGNARLNISAMGLDLSTMNDMYKVLLEECNAFIHGLPVRNMLTELRAACGSLRDVEMRIGQGQQDLGDRRDGLRASVLRLAKELAAEGPKIVGFFESTPRKDTMMMLERIMHETLENIKQIKDSLSGPPASASSDGSNSNNIATRIEEAFSNELEVTNSFPDPDPENSVDLSLGSWKVKLCTQARRIQTRIEVLVAEAKEFAQKMNELSEIISPEIDNVANEAHALLLGRDQLQATINGLLDDVKVEVAIPDLEKQAEIHASRERIGAQQAMLKVTRRELRSEGTHSVELQDSQAGFIVSTPRADRERVQNELNASERRITELRAHRENIVNLIHRLCFDSTDQSICRFPDLLPHNGGLAPDPDPLPMVASIDIPKPLRIKSEKLVIKESIGSDAFSSVFKVEYQETDVVVYAFKKFNLTELDERAATTIADEIETLAALNHPNVVRTLGASGDPNAVDRTGARHGVGIMMEHCENGSLRQFLDRNPQPSMDLVEHLLLDAAEGMKYLHGLTPNIMHFALKSDSILIDRQMRAKIGDVGMSKIIQAKSKSNTADTGTWQYRPPEWFLGENGPETDVYAFGCLMYEALTGKRPWDGLSNEGVVIKVGNEKAKLDFSVVRQDAPPPLVRFMETCLDYDKTKRPSFADISSMLKPPVVLTEVGPTSREFLDVENLFFPAGNEGSLTRAAFCIVKITKIQNEYAEASYETAKINIGRDMRSHNVNEQMIFHGTSGTDPRVVVQNKNGMMRDYSNDGFYGRGLYFAEYPRYSHAGYAYGRQNELGGNLEMVLCSVISGNSLEMGLQIDRTLCLRNMSENHRYEHSVLAGPHGVAPNDSKMVVVYQDFQCTPRYIITYKKGPL
jgi:serine/threonine protein kinase